MPLVEDVLNDFTGCELFSMIDLTGAFTQLKISKQSQGYLTINTHKGLFRYKRLAFGVKSAPCIFQNVIDNILRGLNYVRPYLDDILIGGRTKQECEKNTLHVLDRLNKYNVKANEEKFRFLLSEVQYLG